MAHVTLIERLQKVLDRAIADSVSVEGEFSTSNKDKKRFADERKDTMEVIGLVLDILKKEK